MKSEVWRNECTSSSSWPFTVSPFEEQVAACGLPTVSGLVLCCFLDPLRCCAAKQTSQKLSVQDSQYTCAGWSVA